MGRAFVTGGSGYVGRNLIRALRARGDEVRALARSDAAAETVRALGAEPVPGELADTDTLRDAMSDCDVVYHAAARVGEWGDPRAFHRVNVEGTRSVLAAAEAAGVAALVHVGTEAVYANGHPLTGLDETTPKPRRPLPRYPRTKAIAEDLVLEAASERLRTVVIRPRFIWGGDDTTLLPQLAAAVRSGRFRWIAGGRYPTATTHIDNVVEGLLRGADRGENGEVYFVTDGEATELRGFVAEMLATQGVETEAIADIPRPLATAIARLSELLWTVLPLPGQPPLTMVAIRLFGEPVTIDDSRARRELDYRGATTREAGLADLRARAGAG